MLKSVRVPPGFEAPFARAEGFVEKLFSEVVREPERGAIHIGKDRYLFVRAESLYLAWFDAMAGALGEEAAYDFIYNTARAIGRSDCLAFAERLAVEDGVERLAAGPVHFAHAGWAFVYIFEDSTPAKDDNYYLHYHHPNTFESEVLRSKGKTLGSPGCFFSAGYSSGWCSAAFGLEVHGREIQCVSSGGEACEFVMSVRTKLDEYEVAARACCMIPR